MSHSVSLTLQWRGKHLSDSDYSLTVCFRVFPEAFPNFSALSVKSKWTPLKSTLTSGDQRNRQTYRSKRIILGPGESYTPGTLVYLSAIHIVCAPVETFLVLSYFLGEMWNWNPTQVFPCKFKINPWKGKPTGLAPPTPSESARLRASYLCVAPPCDSELWLCFAWKAVTHTGVSPLQTQPFSCPQW